MAGNTYVQLPSEAGNTGQKVAYSARTEGANSVVIPKVIPEREAVVVGVYRVTSLALQSLSVAAHNGTGTGFFWFMNPAASGRTIRLRRVSLQYGFQGVTTLTTLPRLVMQRFTWTGTPSGAQSLGVNVDSASVVASIADIRTASTGLTNSLTANTIFAVDCPPMAQVSGTAAVFETSPTVRSEMIDADAAEDEWVTIAPGQGVVLYQPDAGGATTETRRMMYNIVWDEVDLSG